MSDKHTPGPWHEHSHRQIGPDAGIVCEVWSALGWGEKAIEEADANCLLIAAAPDLLEALREIADDYADRFDMDSPSTNPGIKYVVAQARAAIAKALGEKS